MTIKAADISATPDCYHVFDFCLTSNFPIPMLAEASSGSAAVRVTLRPDSRADERGFSWFHEWTGADGELVLAGARREGEYLLRFPDLADFHVSSGLDAVTVYPTARGVERITLSHLLIDQVLPRILNQQGRLVTHACAVSLPGGDVVAFLGESGHGKSTLAASFFTSGSAVIADDCIVLNLNGGQVTAIPAYASLRLWPDSLQSIFPGTRNFQAVAQYSDKQQVKLAGAGDSSGASPLSAVFILDGGFADGSSTTAHVCPAAGTDSLMALIKSLFTLDHDDPGVVQRNFKAASQLLQGSVPVFRLGYERRYDALPEVRRAVMEAVGLETQHA